MKSKAIQPIKEWQEQALFVEWFELQYPRLKLFAIPNGELRPFQEREDKRGNTVRYSPTAQKLEAMGLRAGVPDLVIPEPRYPYHGFYLEMKRNDGKSDTTDAQKIWLDYLEGKGYYTIVAAGFEAAKQGFEKYMKFPIWKKVAE